MPYAVSSWVWWPYSGSAVACFPELGLRCAGRASFSWSMSVPRTRLLSDYWCFLVAADTDMSPCSQGSHLVVGGLLPCLMVLVPCRF